MAKKTKKKIKHSLDKTKCNRILDRNGFEYKCIWSDERELWHMTPAQVDEHNGYYINDSDIGIFITKILQVS